MRRGLDQVTGTILKSDSTIGDDMSPRLYADSMQSNVSAISDSASSMLSNVIGASSSCQTFSQ